MCDPVTASIVVGAAAVAGTGASIYQGQKQEKQMEKTTAQNKAASDKQLSLADQEMNRKNPKTAGMEGAGDQTGTLSAPTQLTGPGGVDPNKLLLGKNTLLGG